MIRLFIENHEIELSKGVQISLNKQFEDINNPTTIINDWSRTVSIPFSQTNNKIFGYIFCPDRLVADGGTIGLYFNPYKKLNFRLEVNQDVLMVGYAKLNEVKTNKGSGTYEVTLFGELGKVFQQMKQITFDTTSSNSDFIIHGDKYISEYIDKNLVKQSWDSTGQTHEELLASGDTGYSFTDIIGFAPNNAFSEDFEYDSVETVSNGNSTCMKFTDILGNTTFEEDAKVAPDVAIKDGLFPREIGEYRSYHQLPFIYFNKLFKVFQEKAEEVTGYQFELDDEWFNKNNPYWYNLVYMLKMFNSKDVTRYSNSYQVSLLGLSWGNNYATEKTDGWMAYAEGSVESYPIINAYRVAPFQLKMSKDYSLAFNCAMPLKIQFPTRRVLGTRRTCRINHGGVSDNGLVVTFTLKNDTTSETIATRNCLVVDTEYESSTLGYDEVIKVGESVEVNASYDKFQFTPSIKFGNVTNYNSGDLISLTISGHWLKNTNPLEDSSGVIYSPSITVLDDEIMIYRMVIEVLFGNFRSNNYFSLNDLWNNDYNVFEEILKYCKIYRIGIRVDAFRKKIIFEKLEKYFEKYTVTDWTDKIDKSKDFNIKPITFEDKYVLFNYEDSDEKLNKQYKEKYGVQYGEYRLTTDYNFNSNTANLFDKVHGSIVNTNNVLSWTNLYDYHRVIYSFPAEIFIANKDDDNKAVDLFGAYFFHNGLSNFSTESALRLRNVYISDDTLLQDSLDKYFYTQRASQMARVYTYPNLNIMYGDNMCLFNVPNENYTFNNNYSGKNSVYANFWSKYLDERYNIQNKKITCYVKLSNEEYSGFEFYKFVKVGNQVCIVNKIQDFDASSNATTKVELITIQDIDSYTENTFLENYDQIETNLTGVTSYFGGGSSDTPWVVGTIKSITNLKFGNDQQEITQYGVKFTISGDTLYAQTVEEYVDEPDIDFGLRIHNKYNSITLNCKRYSVYPYPYISITDGNGNEVTAITNGTYTLNWECTPTDDLADKPTVSISTTGQRVRVTEGNDWSVTDKMYTDGEGHEYFKYVFSETLTVSRFGEAGTATFTITDIQGWHQTKTYNVI